jgi:L-fuconolactonase
VSIIDAHHHVWDLAIRDQDWLAGDEMTPIRRSFAVSDLRPDAVAAGVAGTVLVQTVTVAEETPEMLSIAAGDPLVRGVVGWTDLTSPSTADRLAELREMRGGDRLVGIRHQVQSEPDRDWLRRPDVLRGLRAVASAGLAYDLVIRPPQLGASAFAATEVPELTFVLDHAGKPPIASGDTSAWAPAIRALAARPNVVCKLSGLVTEASPGATSRDIAPFADVVLDAFGPHRIMFGSDWPVCLLVTGYRDVVTLAETLVAGVDEPERAAIFAGTAERTYLLKPKDGGETWH